MTAPIVFYAQGETNSFNFENRKFRITFIIEIA
jgi:hypothetical protein